MINVDINDILETINMIKEENLDIRTITMGISLYDCAADDVNTVCDRIYDKITKTAERLVSVGGDIEADKLKIKGALHCEGFIHAKETDIRFNSKTRLGTVNSSKVSIRLKTGKKILQCVYLFPLFIKKLRARTIVNMGISGDDVQVEHIVCPHVTGKKVRIGRGCKIDLVQYSEEIKISKNSKVGKVEKI